ncbi:replication protein [Geobacillus thermodenitrificans]|uniref:replication protein n=1 Tax=Geobacillus thermodenitrificans TaxID=33940 RepID=UPI003D1D6F50
MANPQLDNGFTRIANEILENIYSRKFTANQLIVILVIWRYTYGFQRKEHVFSLSFLAEVTGIDRKAVKRALDSLIEANVIIVVKEADFNNARCLAFNKNYDEWKIDHRGIKNTTVSKNDHTEEMTTVGKDDHTTVGDFDHTTVGKNDHHIKKIYKEKNKENIKEEDRIDHFQLIANKFIQRRAHGFDLSPEDELAIHRLLGDNIPIDIILKYIDEIFDEYEPKHRLDYIKSFKYVEKVILDRYFGQKGEEKNNGGTVHKHRRGVSRSTKEGGKSYEQILREAEAARRAWGWKG